MKTKHFVIGTLILAIFGMAAIWLFLHLIFKLLLIIFTL